MNEHATKVKICGVTRPADATLAADLGAWAVGLNFWEGSPRRCAPDVAEEVGAALKRRCEVAGVFVNAPLDEVARIAERAQLTLLQLHGDEGPRYCAEASRRSGARVIKAKRVHSGADLQALGAYHVDFHLLDAHVPGRPGGTGESFDWELAGAHRASAPRILAGGLTPENVAEAIATARPWAVDVASGVESSPGIKDPERVRAFIEAARSARDASDTPARAAGGA